MTWRLTDGRFVAISAEYLRACDHIAQAGPRFGEPAIWVRDTYMTDSDGVRVAKTEVLSTDVFAADKLMAVLEGQAQPESVQGIATAEQLHALEGLCYDGGEGMPWSSDGKIDVPVCHGWEGETPVKRSILHLVFEEKEGTTRLARFSIEELPDPRK